MQPTRMIGDPPWTREEMKARLGEFSELYQRRPLPGNSGGMSSPHLFMTWFALRRLNPEAIVESGVSLGQGTWFFEQACPDARLVCIEPDLARIQYRSKRAEYFDQDFSRLDLGHLPKRRTALFFDDHQNAYERAKTAKWFGFEHLIFEDNYPAGQGDCYSLKRVFAHAGLGPPPAPKGLRTKLRQAICGASAPPVRIPPNRADAARLMENLSVYYEFPPVFKTSLTRWGDPWDDEKYPTPLPLLERVEAPFQQVYLDEARDYTWMCYARLK